MAGGEAAGKREGEAPQARGGPQGGGVKRFVNPYTFVPFPAAVERRRLAGITCLGQRLSGAFTVTWTFTSPFQAPEGASGTAVLRLPGTSVKGAVRAVHETLAGGCLRVFDAEFIPSYRDHAQVRGGEWKMAVVDKSTGMVSRSP